MPRLEINPQTFDPAWIDGLTPPYQAALTAWAAAERAYRADPAAHLRDFLVRVAPLAERYRSRGKVAALAADAARLVALLASPPFNPFAGYQMSTGCSAQPLPEPHHGAAEDACNRLADELRPLLEADARTSAARAARARLQAPDKKHALKLAAQLLKRNPALSQREIARRLEREIGTPAGTIRRWLAAR